jgi:hypothetical protein
MDGRVPSSSYGSRNESSSPAAPIFSWTEGSRVCSEIASLSGEEDAGDRGYMEKVAPKKKLASLELVYFGFMTSLLDDNIFFGASNSINE